MKAKLDKPNTKSSKKKSDMEMEDLNIEYSKINPQWNYIIRPRKKVGGEK